MKEHEIHRFDELKLGEFSRDFENKQWLVFQSWSRVILYDDQFNEINQFVLSKEFSTGEVYTVSFNDELFIVWKSSGVDDKGKYRFAIASKNSENEIIEHLIEKSNMVNLLEYKDELILQLDTQNLVFREREFVPIPENLYGQHPELNKIIREDKLNCQFVTEEYFGVKKGSKNFVLIDADGEETDLSFDGGISESLTMRLTHDKSMAQFHDPHLDFWVMSFEDKRPKILYNSMYSKDGEFPQDYEYDPKGDTLYILKQNDTITKTE